MMFYPKFTSTKAWKVCLCAVAILLVSGCATVELASPEDDSAAKLFIAPQGGSNIYVTRKTHFIAGAVLFEVVVDWRVVGLIAPGTYRVVSVDPGPHSVSVTTPENQSIEEFDAVAGENYFFEVKAKTGSLSARVDVVPLTESDGRAAIAKNSLAEAFQVSGASLPGNTGALPGLQKDTLRQLMVMESTYEDCKDWKVVNTEIIESKHEVVVERWTVDRCGKQVAYRIQFITSSRGGTDIAITFPPAIIQGDR